MKIIKKYIPDSLYQKLRIVKYDFMKNLMKLFWIFSIKNNKVVFSNFNGKGYGDNPKYIAEQIIKDGRYRAYWLLQDMEVPLPSGIEKVRRGTVMSFFHLATAKVWVFNNRKEPYVTKRKGQFYLQTWHGSIALKRIEKDAVHSLDALYLHNAKEDSEQIDLMISNSKYADKLFGESFWYNGEIYKCGTPRVDILFRNISEKIREKLNIGRNITTVLYAPTFRNSGETDVYQFDFNKLLEVIRLKYGREAKLLLRFHPNLSSASIWGEIASNDVINVTSYPDVYELLAASDILITDYSSLMFEFPVCEEKPVFLFAKDVDLYDRGFYFDIHKLPFALAETEEELYRNIESFDQSAYSSAVIDFRKDAQLIEDGHASHRLVEKIISIVCNE